MSTENVFLNRINELEGFGISDILLACVDAMEEKVLVLTSAESTVEALLSFREHSGAKLSLGYKQGYKEGYKEHLLGVAITDMPYTTFDDEEERFWGWFDGWIDGR